MNNMKNLFILLLLSIAFVATAQRSAIIEETAGADSVIGKTSTSIILPSRLFQEYDYSYQIIPTAVGIGDSVNAAVALYQSNDLAGTNWTEITSARDTITSTAGVLIEGTDADGLKHRITLTGTVLDTTTIIVYQVLKLEKLF